MALFSHHTYFWHWPVLAALSLVCAALWTWLGLPAAPLMGPIFAGILLAARGWRLRTPNGPFIFVQGLIGLLMARSIPAAILDELAKSWSLFIGGTVWAMLTAAVLGWVLTRRGVLPGTTAVWGLSPGAASAMVLMSEDYGGDMRLVAFMQYLRVVCVSVAAALVAHFWAPGAVSAATATDWFPPVHWPAFWGTLAFALVTVSLARFLRFSGGAIILPLVLGAVVHNTGWLRLELPPWLMIGGYVFLGWTIGLRFTRTVLLSAVRAFPQVLGSILLLCACCALFGGFLTLAAGLDPLTAYLATCPGGLDTVVIISTSARVDLPFIVAMQTVRLLLVLAFGPALARLLAQKKAG